MSGGGRGGGGAGLADSAFPTINQHVTRSSGIFSLTLHATENGRSSDERGLRVRE